MDSNSLFQFEFPLLLLPAIPEIRPLSRASPQLQAYTCRQCSTHDLTRDLMGKVIWHALFICSEIVKLSSANAKKSISPELHTAYNAVHIRYLSAGSEADH